MLKPLSKIVDHPLYVRAIIIIIGFIIAFLSILPVKIEKMGIGSLFVLNVIPIPFWLGLAIIAGTTTTLLPHLNEKRYRILCVSSSILLIICFRMAFPISFTSIPAYEPDVTSYMNIVNSWVHSGIDFGVEGNYQHNFPMSFLIAFLFVKLGVPLDTFFRVAPFFIYALDIVILYLLMGEIFSDNKKFAALSCFLFSFTSLGYWLTVHYSPDLLGFLFYFVSLYLIVKFAKNGKWTINSLLPVLVSIFILILSHHLSTLYLIVTLAGLSLAVWYFKPPQFKGKVFAFFILATYTYTIWFLYGSLVYPSFFNIYVYFSGFVDVTRLSIGAGIVNNLTFVIYPAFILVLATIEFSRTLHLKSPIDLTRIWQKLKEARISASTNLPFVFSAGYVFVLFLFLLGIGVSVIQAPRVLEVLCIGLYPLSSIALMRLSNGSNPKRRMLIILAIVLIVVLTGAYRYYAQIQRRIIIA